MVDTNERFYYLESSQFSRPGFVDSEGVVKGPLQFVELRGETIIYFDAHHLEATVPFRIVVGFKRSEVMQIPDGHYRIAYVPIPDNAHSEVLQLLKLKNGSTYIFK